MGKGLLPVGSIFLLKGRDRKLLVIGHCISKEDDESRVFDYAGSLYPEGFEDPDNIYLFNAESIEKVYYVGYTDEKTTEHLSDIEKILKEMKNG